MRIKSRILGGTIIAAGLLSFLTTLGLNLYQSQPIDKTILLACGTLVAVGVAVYIGAYPERIEVLGVVVVLRPAPITFDNAPPPVTPRRLDDAELRNRVSYAETRAIPGRDADPFDIFRENESLNLLPNAYQMTPMYLLDKDFRILDWNDAFTLAFDATMEGRRGSLVIDWVYILENWREVVDHGVKVFNDPANFPKIDIETVRYKSVRYGAFSATKRAYQVPADNGEVQAWLVILDLQFKESHLGQLFNIELIQKLRNNLMWSEYAVSYDNILTSTEVYPELLSIMTGENGELPPIPDDSTVLDLGAGTGNLSLRLAKMGRERRVFALENNRIMLNLLRQKCHPYLRSDDEGPGIVPIRQDINSLFGLNDNQFDVVLLNNVLYSLEDPKPCLEGVHRVLRKGGEVRISGPRKDTKLEKLFGRIRRDLKKAGCFDRLKQDYNRVETINRVMLAPSLFRWESEDVCKLLQEAGFAEATVVTEDAYAGQSMIVWGRK